jgi:RNA polymerase sigma-70 factor, ECF subfamily
MLDDQGLIRGIVNSQEAALAAFYDRYGRLVFSLALRILEDVTLAEEVTQDIFLRIWNKADTYRAEQGKVLTWLGSMTRNRAIDMLRRQKVRPEGHRSDWAEDAFPILQEDPRVEDGVILEQKREKVRQALDSLPGEQRQVLALAYYSGLSHQEIAAELGQPLGTVKTRLRLAMQKLRHTLKDDGTSPPES